MHAEETFNPKYMFTSGVSKLGGNVLTNNDWMSDGDVKNKIKRGEIQNRLNKNVFLK